MIPRCKVGRGVTGAVRYILGEGRDPATGDPIKLGPGATSRVEWIGGTGFGFRIESAEDADLARRMMEFAALNQGSRTRQCEKDCVHISLGWRPGETPSREEMEAAGRSALKALGMENAKALFAAHNDMGYAHFHIVASKINPDTGRAYGMKGDWLKLSRWAERYEREHGGVICVRREEANRLRDAIAARDPGAVLDALTERRATFSARDLERALSKEMKGELERARFTEKVLAHPNAVMLWEKIGGPITRYTTREVLEAEQHVLRAAVALSRNGHHGLSDKVRNGVIGRKQYASISREQVRAFRHATGDSGLALIDGQAGTGKSFTMAAIRDAYQAAGRRVVALGPTNVVAEDKKAEGFLHAATVHSELFALNNGRRVWDRRTVVMVDEAAMVGTKLIAMVTAHAEAARAKLILVGDDRQLSSIDRGGMYGVLKDRFGAAALTEVRRQYKDDDRRAASMMAEGNYHDALAMYEAKGGITWARTQEQALGALVRKWDADSAAGGDKSRFVFAYTNADVAQLNAGVRAVRRTRGELGEDHEVPTADGKHRFAVHDRLQFTGTDKRAGLMNGRVGTVDAIEGTTITVRLDGRHGDMRVFDAEEFPHFRHGYAGTIYKGQGRTLDQTYLYHSEHWRSAPSYVALTRHRDKAELFVARSTAKDVTELARQMARVDDRRAASSFQTTQPIPPVRPMTPGELAARFQETELRRRADQGDNDDRRPREQSESEIGRRPKTGAQKETKVAEDKAITTDPTSKTAEIVDLESDRIKRGSQAMSDLTEMNKYQNLRTLTEGQDGRQAPLPQGDRGVQNATRQAGEVPIEVLAKENAERQVLQTDQMKLVRARLDAYEADQRRQADEGRDEQAKKRRADAEAEAKDGEIRDARDRYRIALGENYDVSNPYGSLAKAAMAEYAAFIKDRERLTLEIAKEQDPEARRLLELKRGIQDADYMAITDHRIASQSEVITGRRNSEGALWHRARAGEYEAQSKALRKEYREIQTERALRQGEEAPQQQTQPTTGAGSAPPDPSMAGLSDAQKAEITRIRERRQQVKAAQKSRHGPTDHHTDDQAGAESQPKVQPDGRAVSQNAPGAPVPETSDAKAAKALEHELGKGEISDAQAAEIARIREHRQQIKNEQKSRASQPRGRGGGQSR